MTKVRVDLIQGNGLNGKIAYRIKKVTNSTDLRIGQYVDKVAVDNFIRNGYTVVITEKK